MKNTVLTLILFLTTFELALAQFGALDPSFGNSVVAGIDTFPLIGAGDFEQAIAFQSDGKILVSTGGAPQGIGRLNTNGAADNSFGNAGWVNVGFFTIGDLSIQTDGRILAAGRPSNISYNDTYVWRYKSNGSLDSTFGYNGRAGDSTLGAGYEHIAIQSGNKIIWSGSLGVKRINITDGSLDISFGSSGFIRTPQLPLYPLAMTVDASTGDILLGGYTSTYHLAVARLTTNGALDNTFGSQGMDSLPIKATGLDVQMKIRINSSGKIILASDCDNTTSYNHIVCAQFNSDGTIDSSFGGNSNGMIYPDWNTTGGNYEFFGGMDIQADGKVLIASTLLDSGASALVNNVALTRLNADGSNDTVYGTAKFAYSNTSSEVQALGIEPDGKPVINGSNANGELVARYTLGYPAGIKEESEGLSSVVFYPNPTRGKSVLSYATVENNEISAAIYAIDGRMVKEIFNHEKIAAGKYSRQISEDDIAPGAYQIVITDKSKTQHISFEKM